jgi:type IV pilus assembly protein PilE
MLDPSPGALDHRLMRPGRGFSLIEMMIVVGLIGVVAALSVPSISETVQRQRASGEFVKVSAAVERARNRARISVCKTLVDVTPASGTMVVKSDPADTDASCTGLASETFKFSTKLVTLNQFKLGATTTNPLVINANGGLTGTAKAIMTVNSPVAGTRASTIEVWPAVGAIRSHL